MQIVFGHGEKSAIVLTIEGVESSRNPLHYGIFHFSSSYTLDTQVLNLEKTKNNLLNCVAWFERSDVFSSMYCPSWTLIPKTKANRKSEVRINHTDILFNIEGRLEL